MIIIWMNLKQKLSMIKYKIAKINIKWLIIKIWNLSFRKDRQKFMTVLNKENCLYLGIQWFNLVQMKAEQIKNNDCGMFYSMQHWNNKASLSW